MARSMTKTPAKTKTPAASKEEVVGVVDSGEKIEEKIEKKETPKAKRVFKETDGILCRSVTSGGLYMVGKKTGMVYEWNAYGHEYEVEYRDLVIAVRTKSDFVFGPMFIIEDEDFIEEFPIVKKFYDDSYQVKDLERILRLPTEEMRESIQTLPPGAKKNIQNLAATAVRNKTIDSLEKIRALDEIFGINLQLLASM